MARADTEATLVEFLGIESINEILRTPEAIGRLKI
jgi:hypothetical protein